MSIDDQVRALFAEQAQRAATLQNRYTVTIGGKDYTKYIPMPVKWEKLLDERLNEGRLSMRHCPAALFTPTTEVVLTVTDKKERQSRLTFLVSADEVTEIPTGSGYYNHELSLIEETKKLEGIIVEPITYTNDLGRTYTDSAIPITVTIDAVGNGPGPDSDKIVALRETLSPKSVGSEYTFISLKKLFSNYAAGITYQWNKAFLKVDYNSKNIYNNEEEHVEGRLPSTLNDDDFVIDHLSSGQYSVEYYINVNNGGYISVTYSFIAVANEAPLPKWNITSVINRLLDLAEPHVKSESPRYRLNDEQAAQFEKILAPEFAFSKMTLRETLDQIGGFIHGIPRLEGNTIYYDMLGGTKQAKLSDPKYPYLTKKLMQNIESYCTKLDSTVDNLVNILDGDEGVITEPYAGGYKTVRSEEAYAQITDGNMIISTTAPIQNVQKLEVGPLPNGATGDITAYLFEAADYGRLSSFDGGYPTSKAFAIYYTQGQPNIKGLSFKAPNAFGGAAAKYAIANIIKAVTGYDISDLGADYPKLSFRITYTPVFSARTEQHKLYYKEFPTPRTLAYNQSANLAETRYYGENLRGTVARMGNPEVTLTYRLSGLSLIPNIGELFGEDYYVASVAAAVYPDYIDCTVGLSKDFNRLSQYIGINSTLRMYEVSEKQAYNRDMVYTDYCVIGDAEDTDNLQMLDAYGLAELVNTFRQDSSYASANPISAACITTLDENENLLHDVTLPVISTAMGNAMVFGFNFADNYSAGEQSVYGNNGEISGYWQTNVPYCDYYGRFYYMKFYLAKTGVRPGYDDPTPFELPAGLHGYPEPINHYLIHTPEENPLVVRKNNTEIIRENYQIHYVSNRKGIVTGPALTHNCPLVRGIREGHAAALYILPTRVGKFEDVLDLSEATLVLDYEASGVEILNNYQIKFADQTAPVSGQAWVIADKVNGELLIGENISITAGETMNLPYISVKHNIY